MMMTLNPDKSDSLLFVTSQHEQFVHVLDSVNVANTVVPLAKQLKLLGVVLNANLTFNQHTQLVYQSPVSIMSERFAKFAIHWIKTQCFS